MEIFRKTRLGLFVLMLLVVSLGGCKTIALVDQAQSAITGESTLSSVDQPVFLSDTGIILDQVNALASENKRWFVSMDKRKRVLLSSYKGTVRPALALFLEQDIYVYEDNKLIEYLETIVERLLEHWKGPQPALSVVVETDNRFNAYVDELGQIHVTTGLLRSLENEDQVAAVLAHELGHIMLRHTQESSNAKKIARMLNTAESVVTLVEAQKTKDNNLRKHTQREINRSLGFDTFGLIWSDLITPNWSRENEREADQLALDLLIRANYNYEEIIAVVEKIHDASAVRSERLDLFEAMVIKQTKEKALNMVSGDYSREVGELTLSIAQSLLDTTSSTIANKRKTHDDREVRIDFIKQYLDDGHDGGELPPESDSNRFVQFVGDSSSPSRLTADLAAVSSLIAVSSKDLQSAQRHLDDIDEADELIGNSSSIARSIALASLEIASNQLDKAIDQLETLVLQNVAPARAYIDLADLRIKRREYEKAELALFVGTKNIGRDYRFLPVYIRLYQQSGRAENAEKKAVRCAKYDGVSWLKELLTFKEINVETGQSYYSRCTAILGYDARSRQQERKKQKMEDTMNKIKGSLEGLKGIFK